MDTFNHNNLLESFLLSDSDTPSLSDADSGSGDDWASSEQASGRTGSPATDIINEQTSSPYASYETRRDRDFWLKDGNVIINVFDHDERIRHQYRVHRTVLRMHSSWWREVFSLLQSAGYSSPSNSTPHELPSLADDADDDEPILGPLPLEGLLPLINPEIQGEAIDGIMIIEAGFQPIPEIFSALLRRMYLPYEVLGPKNDAATNNTVHDMLLLAHYYGMEAIRADLIAHLSLTWPSTLEAWDLNEHDIRAAIQAGQLEDELDDARGLPTIHADDADSDSDNSSDNDVNSNSDAGDPQPQQSPHAFDRPHPPRHISVDLPDPTATILLSRTCNLTSILPAAFYALSRIIWHQTRRPTYPLMNHRVTDEGISYRALLGRGAGPGEDMLRVVMGREKMLERVRLFAMFAPEGMGTRMIGCSRLDHDNDNDPDEEEEESSICKDGVSRYWASRVRAVMLAKGIEDPLQALALLSSDRLFGFGVCTNCEIEVGKVIHDTRMELWNSLASIFELWNEF